MRATKLLIKNFRSFDTTGQEINFPDINYPLSIVGHNNSGKSNFIKSLLYGFGVKSTYNSFNSNDFHNKDTSNPIHIEIEINPPFKSSDAYNKIKEMPIIKLIVNEEDGIFDTSHQFYQSDGKPVFNVTALARAKTKVFSQEEKDILNDHLKKGAETINKWQSKIPVYYIDPITIHNHLKINRNTLLGKVINTLKKDFENKDNKLESKEGLVPKHVGQPRIDVFNSALQYLEKYIITTPQVEDVIKKIEEVVKSQLEISDEDFQLLFGLPTIDAFYDNLTFYVKDNPAKPKLPIQNLGNGFSSLFIVALFRALVDSDKGGNIFIIEEPETYLHEHFQEYFYDVLIKLSEKNQVIITTHSKKFINIFKPESILRFKNEQYLKTEVVQNAIPAIEIPEKIGELTLHSIDDFALYLKSLEPNLNNIVFSSKVIIVEGPHDLLAYKTFLSKKYNLAFNNIAIVSAWGKDTIKPVVQICQRYEIPYFVIHDWDLQDDKIEIEEKNIAYSKLDTAEKAQFTKNLTILAVAKEDNVHQNKRNLESVLNIKVKGTTEVFEKLNAKTFDSIVKEFPKFTSEKLLAFLSK
jgi:putative ATP-dependent endonuclease of the OLD family